MKGTVLYGPGDIRFEDRETPKILAPTDAILRLAATCVCGSDLWPYRGLQPIDGPTPMGHEYCGFVEEVGAAVRSITPGQFVVGSFATSDNTCPHCQYGYQSSCIHREFMLRAQAPFLRVPQADGTLVPTPGEPPSDDFVPSLLACSDVLGTGWFAADAASVKPGGTVVVVGDGAVGLLGVLSAKQMGAARIIAMSRHDARQKLAREFALTPGMILSNEPGYYAPGAFGIRTENLMVVEPRALAGAEREMLGFETLTLAPIDLTLIDWKLMGDREIKWLDAYHARVRKTLSPLLDAATRRWLNGATRRRDVQRAAR